MRTVEDLAPGIRSVGMPLLDNGDDDTGDRTQSGDSGTGGTANDWQKHCFLLFVFMGFDLAGVILPSNGRFRQTRLGVS